MTEQIDQVLDALSEIVVYHDTKMRIIWANAAASCSKDTEGRELVGGRCHELWHGRDAPCEGCPVARTLQTGEPGQGTSVTPDGRVWEIRSYPVLDEQGELSGAAEVALDVTERVRALEKLRENETRFRELFESIATAVAVYEARDDGEDFVFKDFNRAAEQIEQLDRSEVVGKSVLEVFPAVKEFGLFEVLRKVWRTAKPEVLPIKLYEDERISAWRENYVYKLPTDEVVAVYEDVTSRKRAEEAQRSYIERLKVLRELDAAILSAQTPAEIARAAVEHLQRLVPSFGSSVVTFDAEATTATVLATLAHGHIYYTDDRISMAPFEPIIAELRRGEIFVVEDTAILAERLESLAVLSSMGVGGLLAVPLHADAQLIGALIIATEQPELITSKKVQVAGEVAFPIALAIQRTELLKRVQLQSERLQVLNDLDQAILAAHTPDEIARAGLEHMLRLVPFDSATLLMTDIDTVDDAEQATVRMLADLRTGGKPLLPHDEASAIGPFRELLVRLEGIDTYYVPELSELADAPFPLPLLQASGRRSALILTLISRGNRIGAYVLTANEPGAFSEEQIAIAREIASVLAIAIQQSALHEQVRRHADELEQRVVERTVRLEEINAEMEAFAYSVSHDLRAPLRAMQGLAKVLLDEHGDTLDESGRALADRIVASADGMDGLIQDLLEYSRVARTELELKPVDLGSAVRVALGQLEAVLARAEVEADEGFQMVQGHPSLLVQIAANLISNAVKFVPEDTRPRLCIRCEDRDERVRLWVEDNGIGIAPEHQERIFRVFERLHGAEEYPGTGIGLATVRKAIERLGGSVGVESAAGQGSRFWVELRKA